VPLALKVVVENLYDDAVEKKDLPRIEFRRPHDLFQHPAQDIHPCAILQQRKQPRQGHYSEQRGPRFGRRRQRGKIRESAPFFDCHFGQVSWREDC
jgi:hypothetical protein